MKVAADLKKSLRPLIFMQSIVSERLETEWSLLMSLMLLLLAAVKKV